MSKNQSPNTPENWDDASIGYAEKVAPLLMEDYVEDFVNYLEVDKESNALEVAAGSGALTVVLSKKVKCLKSSANVWLKRESAMSQQKPWMGRR